MPASLPPLCCRTRRMCSYSTSASVKPRLFPLGSCSSFTGASRLDRRLRMTQRSTKFSKLPDISGPVPLPHPVHGSPWNVRDALVHLFRTLLNEVLNQQTNVISSFSQWRHPNGKNVQTIVEIAAELLFVDATPAQSLHASGFSAVLLPRSRVNRRGAGFSDKSRPCRS
jgi:hypothetical protein